MTDHEKFRHDSREGTGRRPEVGAARRPRWIIGVAAVSAVVLALVAIALLA